MDDCLRNVFHLLRQSIPRSLLDDVASARILDRLGHLPALDALYWGGLEFRLSDPAASTDFILADMLYPPVRNLYVERGKKAAADSRAAGLGRLLEGMGDGNADSPVAGCFTGAMLEYDFAEVAPDQRPAPGVWLKVNRDQACDPVAMTTFLTRGAAWDDGEWRAPVQSVFAALPADGYVFQMGVMPDRQPRMVSLLVKGIKAREVPDFLRRVGWPGRMGNVVDTLAYMEDVVATFNVFLSVAADGPSPRLGVELLPRGRDMDVIFTAGGSDPWRPIVQRLEARGWCLPEKGRAILAIPGRTPFFDSKGVFMFFKAINHAKLVLQDDAVQAKVYVLFTFRPLLGETP